MRQSGFWAGACRLGIRTAGRYNVSVSSAENQSEPHAERHEDVHRHHRHAVYASETAGLLLIAFLLLALTLIRYWHDIHWSLR